MAEKNGLKKKLTSPKTEWHNSTVVKELLARADERGPTPELTLPMHSKC